MKNKYLLYVGILMIFAGCSKPSIDLDTIPKLQIPKKQAMAKRKKGALYSQQGSSLFSDKKDLQIGDILQVIVQEGLTNKSKGARTLKKANDTSLGGGMIVPMNGVSLTAGTNKFNKNFGLGFKSATTNSFAGSATSTMDENFATKISVIIQQTYQNGNYFVRGSKQMLIDGQKQSIGISGVIRPYDITPENTVYSEQLANLKINYVKEGEEDDVNHLAWGTKLLQYIWPF